MSASNDCRNGNCPCVCCVAPWLLTLCRCMGRCFFFTTASPSWRSTAQISIDRHVPGNCCRRPQRHHQLLRWPVVVQLDYSGQRHTVATSIRQLHTVHPCCRREHTALVDRRAYVSVCVVFPRLLCWDLCNGVEVAVVCLVAAASLAVAENTATGTPLTVVTAVDIDFNETIVYSIGGSTHPMNGTNFAISSAGVLSVNGLINYEARRLHQSTSRFPGMFVAQPHDVAILG